jgi:hypothetical protein
MPDAAAEILAEIKAVFPAQRGVLLSMVNSVLGDEPARVALAFADKTNWTTIDPKWLDGVPDGFASALSFLSDEAICFYIPAYLEADMTVGLIQSEPVYHLVHGFDVRSRHQRIWPNRTETWTDYSVARWSRLTTPQVKAVVHYLDWRASRDPYDATSISEALSWFWCKRASCA